MHRQIERRLGRRNAPASFLIDQQRRIELGIGDARAEIVVLGCRHTAQPRFLGARQGSLQATLPRSVRSACERRPPGVPSVATTASAGETAAAAGCFAAEIDVIFSGVENGIAAHLHFRPGHEILLPGSGSEFEQAQANG